MTLLKFAKKIKLRTRKSMSTKSVSRYKKLLSDNANYFSLSYKTFSRALNYAQDFGTTVKESLKRTTNSKWATLTKSQNCLVSNTFMPLSATLNYVSPIRVNSDTRR